jgi:hypothetical protein
VSDARKDIVNQIPDVQVPGTTPQQPEQTLADKVVGAGEAALTVGTGAVGGSLGMIGGTLKGMAEQILAGKFGTQEALRMVENSAMQGAQALTYAPRTQTGQEMAGKAGEVLSNVALPIAPLAAETAAISAASKGAAPIVAPAAQAVTKTAMEATKKTVAPLAEKIQSVLPESMTQTKPTAGTAASGGSAGVDMATLRQAKADELPVPIKLTEGQKTRTFEQQRFERETAKIPETGAPLRDRFVEQNRQLQQNFDAFIDQSGAEAASLRGIGESVDKALRTRAARDKAEIRTLYKDAEKAGEMSAPVVVPEIAKFLTENAPEGSVANVIPFAKSKGLQLGIFKEGPSGELIPQPSTLKNVELYRRSINAATNAEPTNIRFASELKGLIDQATENAGGDVYKAARAARARYAQNYENITIAKQLLNTKRGASDRQLALEHVLDRSVLSQSATLDSVRQVRRLLQTEGEAGQQAWRDIQGGVLQHIKDEALKNVAPDQAGNRVLSPAQLDRVISNLDKSGKLDFVFGKKGAEMLRTVKDVAKDVLTSPAGTVNTSNTATVLAGLMDTAISGSVGVPVPLATAGKWVVTSIKDRKLKAKVAKALGEKQ